MVGFPFDKAEPLITSNNHNGNSVVDFNSFKTNEL